MNKINTFNKIVGTILIILLIAITLLIVKMDNILPFIRTGALIVTTLIILRYTIETRRLREETHKLGEQSVLQTEIQIRPLLIVTFDEKMSCFIIKNIGNGIALNVETEGIPILALDVNSTLKFSFAKIEVMTQNEEMKMPIKVFGDAQELSSDWVANLDPRYANRNYEFRVKYENINGNKYQTIGTTGKGGVHIKKIGKV